MKKYINLANSTVNLYVLYIKLAQNTKQFRRLVLENFIISLISYLVENTFYGLRPWVFGLPIIPPCASKPLPYNVQSMVTHIQAKAFAGTRGEGMAFKKMFSDFYIF